MHFFVDDGRARKPLSNLSYPQTRQAAAIMDCIGRLIPQEGVDYDADIIFRSEYDSNVSLDIRPHTDKGEWWKRFVTEMIRKYPPSVENPEPSMPIGRENVDGDAKETELGGEDEKTVS